MTTSIERGAEAINKMIGHVFPGVTGRSVSTELATAVLGAVDVDDLSKVIARVQNVPFVGTRQRMLATAIKAHLADGLDPEDTQTGAPDSH